MKSLSRKDERDRKTIVKSLRVLEGKVNDAIVDLNHGIEIVNTTIRKYNEALLRAAGFRDTVVNGMQEYIHEQSDSWEESEAGGEYLAWQAAWQELDITGIDPVEEIDPPEMDTAESLEELWANP
jgi:hypothetical protein